VLKAEFDVDFGSVDKVAKNSCKKIINEKLQKNGDFDFYY